MSLKDIFEALVWHEAEPLRLIAAIIGGGTAVVAMAAIGERWLTRQLAWWKVAALASAIVLVMHPAEIANVLAVAIVGGIGLMEWRARPEATTRTAKDSP